ncbi:hypothetical protein [Cryptosporangium sp. NPDC048952]|uniref:hypothetical protein n=1 Tax=Cryptosporangium sp. NPDC048952 TaxID=3363961 RepID=UPI00371DF079
MRILLADRRPLQRAELVIDFHEDEHALALDARALRWASPLELAAIVTLANDAHTRGRKVALVLPEDRDVAAYLARMNVVDLLEPIAEIDGTIPTQTRRDHSSKLLEVTGVTRTDASAVAAKLGRMTTSRLGSKIGVLAFKALGELLDNATNHGRSDIGAFTAAQLYTGASSGLPGFEFAVCDAGMSIFESLRASVHHQDLEDDRAALEHALQNGVSSTPSPGRGHGLGDLGDQVTREGGGRMLLRSGSAVASVVLRARRLVTARPVATPTNGTWAWLRVRVP